MLHLKQGHQLTFQKQSPAQMQTFRLTPTEASCSMGPVEVDFCSANGMSSLPMISGKSNRLACLFVAPLEQTQSETNELMKASSTEKFLTETFERKVARAQKQAGIYQKVVLKAKPLSNYCQVCEQKYSNFDQHVKHDIHRKNVNENEFSRHIERLVVNFQSEQKKDFKRSRPVGQKSALCSAMQRPVKKIVLTKQERGTVSITRVSSDLS